MHPSVETNEGSGGTTWEVLQAVTETTRANLVADIVGHPKGAPSVDELDYMNPDLKVSAIRRYLNELVEKGVLSELVVAPGNRMRGYPYKFYTVSTGAREVFDRNNLFPESAWQRQYERVEKTPTIRELEQMPRPETQ